MDVHTGVVDVTYVYITGEATGVDFFNVVIENVVSKCSL